MELMRADIEESLEAFIAVAALGKEPISRDEMTVEFQIAPHQPPSHLPVGKLAIYGFWRDGEWLKIGKAGPKSGPRYVNQHYSMKAPSTLAKSLVADVRFLNLAGFDALAPGKWIKDSTHRVNILLSSDRGPGMLSLLEAFLHVRLKPRYEGFASQRAARSMPIRNL